ncbi:MAG: shikimate kinase [Gammaproteobacteria bacterium]
MGKIYGEQFNTPFVDTDALMLAAFKEKKYISELYEELGESDFRNLEEKIIKDIKRDDEKIIATGGGAITHTKNIMHLQSLGQLLYLNVDKLVLYKRMINLQPLPRFIDRNNINESIMVYLHSRDAIYESVADEVFHITNETPEELAIQLHEYRCSYGQ